jgi:peroxiredoxin
LAIRLAGVHVAVAGRRQDFSLDSTRGKVVIAFYPGDFTPG